jgi:hypothetical protein
MTGFSVTAFRSLAADVCRVAQNLARNAGFVCFPCAGDKRPMLKDWPNRASSDPAEIKRLWRDSPGPLIGIVTGRRSGESVLDIDRKHPEAVAWWQDSHKLLLPTRVFQTRSGGLHLWFLHRDGVTNTQGKIAPGVDTRGEGGYAIYWYAAGFPCLDYAPPAPWPAWLLGEIAPPRRRAYQPPKNEEGGGRLDGIVRRLGNTREGERNAVLSWAACRCVEMQMQPARIEALLTPAAIGTGLTELEIRRTIASAIRRRAA